MKRDFSRRSNTRNESSRSLARAGEGVAFESESDVEQRGDADRENGRMDRRKESNGGGKQRFVTNHEEENGKIGNAVSTTVKPHPDVTRFDQPLNPSRVREEAGRCWSIPENFHGL